MISFRNDNPGRHLCILIALVIPFLITWGTLRAWPAASQVLPAFGSGPYIPVWYSYRSHSTDGGPTFEQKSITYIAPSASFSTFSSFQVTTSGSKVEVKEIPSGLFHAVASYFAIYFFLFLCLFRIGPKR